MAKNLTEYLEEHVCRDFTGTPRYVSTGDYITYFLRDDRAYARRVDDLLTVYLSFDTHELVGFKIKGVRHLVEKAGIFGVCVNDGEVRLGMFFWAGAINAKSDFQVKQYEELGKLAKDIILDKKLILTAS